MPQAELSVAGRLWSRLPDLRRADVADAAYAVEVDTEGRGRVRVGPGTPDGATVELRYRTGLGAAGNRPAQAVTTIAAAHPGLLSTFNPLPMTGGEDPEPADVSRARANGGIHALDRAVSLDDVASVARDRGRGAPGRGLPRRRSGGATTSRWWQPGRAGTSSTTTSSLTCAPSWPHGSRQA